jgi:hypothetical protein
MKKCESGLLRESGFDLRGIQRECAFEVRIRNECNLRRAIIQIIPYQDVSQMEKTLKKAGFVAPYDEGYFPALRHITLFLSHEINYS